MDGDARVLVRLFEMLLQRSVAHLAVTFEEDLVDTHLRLEIYIYPQPHATTIECISFLDYFHFCVKKSFFGEEFF